MPYTMKDFQREYIKEHLPQLTPEEQEDVLQSLPPEQRLAGLPPEQRLAGLPPEQRLAGLPPEQRLAGLPPEQRLAGLSAEEMEQIREYMDRLSAKHPSSPRRSRRKK